MKRLEFSLLIALLFGAVLRMSALQVECDGIRGSVLRLHVLANSDTAEDQRLKLDVRDRLLEVSGELFSQAKSREDAIKSAESHLAYLQKEAEKVVQAEGYQYPVEVRLEETYFTTRSYGEITLPAGNYQALRVVIGEGEGHNWWCVMFPPLCLSAASEDETQLEDVLDPQQMELVQGSEYEMKFKCVELYEEWKRSWEASDTAVSSKAVSQNKNCGQF